MLYIVQYFFTTWPMELILRLSRIMLPMSDLVVIRKILGLLERTNGKYCCQTVLCSISLCTSQATSAVRHIIITCFITVILLMSKRLISSKMYWGGRAEPLQAPRPRRLIFLCENNKFFMKRPGLTPGVFAERKFNYCCLYGQCPPARVPRPAVCQK